MIRNMTEADLVRELRQSGVLKSQSLIQAFQAIDRADFILPEYKEQAYSDYPLPIGFGQTISQTYTVAFMLELLSPQAGEKILDVGSGSGWTTALLSELVQARGQVWGVEKIPELVIFSKTNLQKYHYPWAQIVAAGPVLGLPYEAPFDKILVSAAASALPQELVNQLALGGRLVIPINHSIWRVDKISAKKLEQAEFFGFSFVPLRS